MILCLGIKVDPTFAHTVSRLRIMGLEVEEIDFLDVVLQGSFYFDINEPDKSWISSGREAVEFRNVSTILLRTLDVSSSAPTDALASRSRTFLLALTEALGNLKDRLVANPPASGISNFSKVLHQSRVGEVAGVRSPRTLLTNDAVEVLRFIASCGGTALAKGCSAAKTWAATFSLQEAESRLEHLGRAPVLLQEFVNGDDVRVHVVLDECFAERIRSKSIDYRGASGNTYAPVELPTLVRDACLLINKFLGLVYSGIDFKLTQDGEWFFLEANSLPCYEGYDRRSGHLISASLGRALAASARNRGSG